MEAFAPACLALRGLFAEPTQLALQGDETQFMQNAFTVGVLLLTLLLGSTVEILFQRQERLFKALYAEVSDAQVLIEQTCLVGGLRGGKLLHEIEVYINDDLRLLGRPRLLMPAGVAADDPFERLLFMTSVGVPSVLCDSVRSLRQARAKRLAAAQREFPAAHFFVAGACGVFVLLTFFLLGAGLAGFGDPPPEAAGEALQPLSPLFGFFVTILALTVGVLRELIDPNGVLYGVRAAADEAVGRLLSDLLLRHRQLGSR